MSGRKISFRINGEQAASLERLTRRHSPNASDVASDALDLYTKLSASDHEAIRHIERFGGVDDTRVLMERISRAVQVTWYEIALRRIRLNLANASGEPLESEDELLAITARVSKRPC
jgi:hypothetical protein